MEECGAMFVRCCEAMESGDNIDKANQWIMTFLETNPALCVTIALQIIQQQGVKYVAYVAWKCVSQVVKRNGWLVENKEHISLLLSVTITQFNSLPDRGEHPLLSSIRSATASCLAEIIARLITITCMDASELIISQNLSEAISWLNCSLLTSSGCQKALMVLEYLPSNVENIYRAMWRSPQTADCLALIVHSLSQAIVSVSSSIIQKLSSNGLVTTHLIALTAECTHYDEIQLLLSLLRCLKGWVSIDLVSYCMIVDAASRDVDVGDSDSFDTHSDLQLSSSGFIGGDLHCSALSSFILSGQYAELATGLLLVLFVVTESAIESNRMMSLTPDTTRYFAAAVKLIFVLCEIDAEVLQNISSFQLMQLSPVVMEPAGHAQRLLFLSALTSCSLRVSTASGVVNNWEQLQQCPPCGKSNLTGLGYLLCEISTHVIEYHAGLMLDGNNILCKSARLTAVDQLVSLAAKLSDVGIKPASFATTFSVLTPGNNEPWISLYSQMITRTLSATDPSRCIPMMEPLLCFHSILQPILGNHSTSEVPHLYLDFEPLLRAALVLLLERSCIPTFISDAAWLREANRRNSCIARDEIESAAIRFDSGEDLDIVSYCHDLRVLRLEISEVIFSWYRHWPWTSSWLSELVNELVARCSELPDQLPLALETTQQQNLRKIETSFFVVICLLDGIAAGESLPQDNDNEPLSGFTSAGKLALLQSNQRAGSTQLFEWARVSCHLIKLVATLPSLVEICPLLTTRYLELFALFPAVVQQCGWSSEQLVTELPEAITAAMTIVCRSLFSLPVRITAANTLVALCTSQAHCYIIGAHIPSIIQLLLGTIHENHDISDRIHFHVGGSFFVKICRSIGDLLPLWSLVEIESHTLSGESTISSVKAFIDLVFGQFSSDIKFICSQLISTTSTASTTKLVGLQSHCNDLLVGLLNIVNALVPSANSKIESDSDSSDQSNDEKSLFYPELKHRIAVSKQCLMSAGFNTLLSSLCDQLLVLLSTIVADYAQSKRRLIPLEEEHCKLSCTIAQISGTCIEAGIMADDVQNSILEHIKNVLLAAVTPLSGLALLLRSIIYSWRNRTTPISESVHSKILPLCFWLLRRTIVRQSTDVETSAADCHNLLEIFMLINSLVSLSPSALLYSEHVDDGDCSLLEEIVLMLCSASSIAIRQPSTVGPLSRNLASKILRSINSVWQSLLLSPAASEIFYPAILSGPGTQLLSCLLFHGLFCCDERLITTFAGLIESVCYLLLTACTNPLEQISRACTDCLHSARVHVQARCTGANSLLVSESFEFLQRLPIEQCMAVIHASVVSTGTKAYSQPGGRGRALMRTLIGKLALLCRQSKKVKVTDPAFTWPAGTAPIA